jgi:lysyl endopeptidase
LKKILRKKKLSTHLIPGESLFIEYFEPKETIGIIDFHLSKIVYGYKEIFGFQKNNHNQPMSGSCERDVNCPEGADFCKEKYSVAILLAPHYYNTWGYCSGSLINNGRNDFTPYFLTAFHCVDADENGVLSDVEKADVDSWSFRFGYMRQSCGSGNTLTTFDFSGADFRAAYVYSDFALLELQQQPISGQANNFPDVFYNGWDRTGNIPNSVVAIHHPDGDLMKISVSNQQPNIIDNYTHWDVDWTTGTTEGGSSGSPLYDPNQRVIGQDHYGIYPTIQDPCSPDKQTAYGMISVSWDGGGTSDTRLKDWLDPNNSGVFTLDGIHLNNNIYGHIYSTGTQNFNAYNQLNIGSGIHSSVTTPFRVESGATVNLTAGSEIHIQPCTQIVYGSSFEAKISNIPCSTNIQFSERDAIYTNDCGTQYPGIIKQSNNSPGSSFVFFEGNF